MYVYCTYINAVSYINYIYNSHLNTKYSVTFMLHCNKNVWMNSNVLTYSLSDTIGLNDCLHIEDGKGLDESIIAGDE